MSVAIHHTPISLYIHMPWCIKKCPYCDFNSHALQKELPEDQYIQALIRELQEKAKKIDNRPIYSIFIGGGTPSLFSATAYKKLWQAMSQILNLPPNIEITLEANPGTVEQERFYGYRDVGINRISLGIQSFNEKHLKKLGRIHSGQEAEKAVSIARQAQFENINLDLMHGLPNQNLTEALDDLTIAIHLNPTHISWYQLTLEPNTFFHKQPPPLPTDDHIWEMQQKGQVLLAQHGFSAYEVSAYADEKYHCQHNTNYWEFGDYLGIGAGAHSKITDKNGMVKRHANISNPKNYMELSPTVITEEKIITNDELLFEFMLNRLRLKKPILHTELLSRTPLTTALIPETFQQAAELQFVTLNKTSIQLTELGHRFLNDVIELFLPTNASSI